MLLSTNADFLKNSRHSVFHHLLCVYLQFYIYEGKIYIKRIINNFKHNILLTYCRMSCHVYRKTLFNILELLLTRSWQN